MTVKSRVCKHAAFSNLFSMSNIYLQIVDPITAEASEFKYLRHEADLLHAIRDITENSRVGDRINLQFDFDTINKDRLQNFLSIMQLYEQRVRA